MTLRGNTIYTRYTKHLIAVINACIILDCIISFICLSGHCFAFIHALRHYEGIVDDLLLRLKLN
jgi:hypothetical protein